MKPVHEDAARVLADISRDGMISTAGIDSDPAERVEFRTARPLGAA